MKKAIVILLCLCLCTGVLTVGAGAVEENNGVALFIDGESFAPPAPLIIKNGTTYIPLKAFCERMDPTAVTTWDDATKTANISCTGLEISASLCMKYFIANGRYLYIPDGCFTSAGNTMVPVRQLAKVFGATISWDSEAKAINLKSGGTIIESGEVFYNQDDLFWLSRIIFAESGAECLDGQIGVGNVVLNRVANYEYPDTIYDVIFDDQFGTQFTPVANGAVFNTPSAQAEIAAMLVLDGATTVSDSLFFVNKAIATSRWIDENCEFVITIGGHSFYV